MGLKKEKTLASGAVGDYWRILEVRSLTADGLGASVVLGLYVSKDLRDQGAEPLARERKWVQVGADEDGKPVGDPFAKRAGNVLAELYDTLKTDPEFEGSVDL